MSVSAPADPAVCQTGSLCRHILDLHQRLRSQSTLAPCPAVNELFGDLVSTCVHAEPSAAASVLADPRIDGVRSDLVHLCAEGETLLERAWAHRALADADPRAVTEAFPYLENYQQLSRLEVHALAGAGLDPETTRRVCFVGGGPLPLSAVMLCGDLAAEITVVDRDADAVELADRLVRQLDLAGRIRVLLADATDGEGMASVLAGCDVVVVAALVGMTGAQKRVVLRTVGGALAPGARLLIRTADGLRSLLYPVVDLRDVRAAGFLPETLVHPLGEVVNSVLVARRQ